MDTWCVAVVIPSYKVAAQILDVLDRIGPEVERIIVVDDKCPDGTGCLVESRCSDPRVRVIYNEENQGVGGAVLAGYRAACDEGVDVIVKLDGDGQMNPNYIPSLIAPIVAGEADYTKGNRFFNIEDVKAMPKARLIGNAGLSFLTKLSSGYWYVFDPTNGFTAIHSQVARLLPFDKVARRFFFESDMLFRLNTIGAVVVDIPMEAIYADEKTNLNAAGSLVPFAFKHAVNFSKRIAYSYFVRNFNLASVELILGIFAVLFGSIVGTTSWVSAHQEGTFASAGTVMLSAMPIIVGMQMILGFLSYDINSVPRIPFHKRCLAAYSRPLTKNRV
jgi:glycosyltransferase involved in cell wall biosynthesis